MRCFRRNRLTPFIQFPYINNNHQDPGTSDDSCREKKEIKREREAVVIKRDPESEDNRVSDVSEFLKIVLDFCE
ncbi:unnamed protein product [Nesidiocoris tenuis]|uniref:Uncharacterized protein n=1 Tax=Nesidiocoris tenuis TaxID=355587 RepID=A0A6H5H1V3_9HEMI|nr:unnamed protein product [Nesidiocoris tenuis]